MRLLSTFAVFVVLAAAASAEDQKPRLAGTVQDSDGRPLKGATVFISTAAPRVGLGVL
jgi:hypothetical protein